MRKRKSIKGLEPVEIPSARASLPDSEGRSAEESVPSALGLNQEEDQHWFSLTLLGALLVAAFFSWALRSVEFDDAYISYRFAINLAAGDGLSFNPGERIEGYTNLLWVLMLAGAKCLGFEPHVTGPLLGVASYLGIILLSWQLVRRLPQRNMWVPAGLPYLLLATLVIPKGFAAPAGSGLESHFFSFLIVLLGLTQHVVCPTRSAGRFFANLVPIAVVMTRPDGVLIVGASWAVSAAQELGKGPAAACRATAARVWPGLVGMACYSLWKLSYFGSLVPNTYYARGADVPQVAAGVNYLRSFLGSYPQVLLMVPLIAVACVYAESPRLRALSFFSALATLLYSAYLVRVGGDFMEYRQALHVFPLVVCGAAVGLGWIAARSRRLAGTAVVVILVASLMPAGLEMTNYMQSLEEMDSYVKVGRKVGLSLQDLPPRTRVATTLIGTIGYYSGLTIVDQWGLVDPAVKTRPARETFFRGHVKFAGPEVAAAQGANLYLEHPHTCSCANPDVEALTNVFIRLGEDECVRAWYMTVDRELTWIFCSHPETYSVFNFECQ